MMIVLEGTRAPTSPELHALQPIHLHRGLDNLLEGRYLNGDEEEWAMTEADRETIQGMLDRQEKNIDNMLDRRFETLDRRFETIDQKFETIKVQFCHMDSRFEKIDSRFEKVDSRFEKVEERIGRVEEAVKQQTLDLVKVLREDRESNKNRGSNIFASVIGVVGILGGVILAHFIH